MKTPRNDLSIDSFNVSLISKAPDLQIYYCLEEILFNPFDEHIKLAIDMIKEHFPDNRLHFAYKLITYVAEHRPHSWFFLSQIIQQIPPPPKPLNGCNFVYYLVKKGILPFKYSATRGRIDQSAEELLSGYPLTSLSHYIRTDDLDRVIGSPLDAGIFQMKLKLGDKEAPILGFAMYYNSDRVVKWLLTNECSFGQDVAEYAAMSGNLNYIHMCQQKGISLRNYINTIIEYHHNDILRDVIGSHKIAYDTQLALRIHNTLFLAWLGTSKNLLVERTEGGMTPMLRAAGDNNVEYVKFLETKGAKVSAKDKQGTNALIRAARHGAIDVVKYICQEKSNCDHSDIAGNTALAWAALKGHPDVMQVLIDKGADVNKKNNKGVSPMYNALQSRCYEAFEVLAKNGADLEEIMVGGVTPLIFAILNGMIQVIDKLLELGVKPDTKDSYGSTPLMHAAKEWQPKVAIKLLKYGANPEIQDPKGLTALQYTFCDEIKEMLRAHH
ncbi:hypothetical protein TVAG_257540 [Trichomonas vaginalis G3]|uniref:Uncharacterized protein n=1 Tax=Trichomonas vaginalis (strain ATCC PRA-98 / G3) TaxID=412133 RepID=A2ELI8_TRIV3|nr:protein ubiquitination [Trichomonas vaginalis G3]EAY06515.1 hypothetical protein TVAG_257540 [Trichomonas vaginalis G3]KAI5538848.1 protein ubiquitination [Trichomonas vaginalis G3]|eukprot:XP_001318738.1 hypothetical protein [Trichomonas vaginalis G3]